ncbi:Aldehyde dehydrogenase family protein [Rhodococcus sp. RD6.2]|jgi:gamma-glutamyl-gamma-aminobutyraldehyde dehydrogenase|uniref:aldehyde dehydrogenase family protein n=1 Tax=Rhodococcus sp. RD6.2 TaxID=260936 RepID=UPI00063B6C62|nr:aldehyde dehydrogenase family protein [Rhodococcus sp. RD6.2]CRK51543.1 Aldehyde dehydrogenase family protein [Rhodococcus sp. RD6.2]
MAVIPDARHEIELRQGAYVGGRLVDVGGADRVAVVSPRDGRTIGYLHAADRAFVDHAVAVARRAFDTSGWAGAPMRERGDVLVKWAGLVAESARDLASTVSLEMGKPVSQALNVELAAVEKCLRWYGELAGKRSDALLAHEDSVLAYSVEEPAGVVAAVVPWNFPLTMTVWKLAPALLAGNAVVLKPAEQTPFSALLLAELGSRAGLPDGILNVVNGLGREAGQALGRHPDVDVVTFTGSPATGRAFMNYSAESNGKRVWPELGGKSATVVLRDADVRAAATSAAENAFFNQGQMCSASSRLIVLDEHADEAVAVACEVAAALQPADPLDPATGFGAIVGLDALAGIEEKVADALEQGATLAAGSSRRAVVPGLEGGAYFAPVVLDHVRPETRIAQDEVFGPVLSVIRVASEDEAISVANGTRYGLAAGVWGRDVAAIHRVTRALRAGVVWVNCYEEGDMRLPFGGIKESGFGRDKGADALHKYTDTKSVWMRLDG